MFSWDPFSDPMPSPSLNLTVEILAKLKSANSLSCLSSDETEIVIIEISTKQNSTLKGDSIK